MITVTRCEECPCWSEDIDGSEYCSQGGSPDMRYSGIGEMWTGPQDLPPIPANCPLKQGDITITLEKL